MDTGQFNANLLNGDFYTAALHSTQFIMGMAREGPLPRSEIAVKLNGLLDLLNFEAVVEAALEFELPNLCAFPTSTLVKFSSTYMSVIYELAKATEDCLQLVMDTEQRHSCYSYLNYMHLCLKGLYTGKTEKFKARGTFTHLCWLTCAPWVPLPPSVVCLKLGIPCVAPVTFPATSDIDALPGVQERREFWEKHMDEKYDRPYCRCCGSVFRDNDVLQEHLRRHPLHKQQYTVQLRRNVSNREVVECAMTHLDESQREFIMTILRGLHVILFAKAGSGKTATLLCFQEVAKILLGELGYLQYLGFCAPTNYQAAVLGARTFHSLWGIGTGEDAVDGTDLYQTFMRSSARQLTDKFKVFCHDEVFKQQYILGEFLSKAALHGCPMGTVNPFQVSLYITLYENI